LFKLRHQHATKETTIRISSSNSNPCNPLKLQWAAASKNLLWCKLGSKKTFVENINCRQSQISCFRYDKLSEGKVTSIWLNLNLCMFFKLFKLFNHYLCRDFEDEAMVYHRKNTNLLSSTAHAFPLSDSSTKEIWSFLREKAFQSSSRLTLHVLGFFFKKLTQVHIDKRLINLPRYFNSSDRCFVLAFFIAQHLLGSFYPFSARCSAQTTTTCPFQASGRTDFSCCVQFRLRIYFTLKVLPCSELVKWEQKRKKMDQLNEHKLEFVVSEENKC
jgi:hypothetical protein